MAPESRAAQRKRGTLFWASGRISCRWPTVPAPSRSDGASPGRHAQRARSLVGILAATHLAVRRAARPSARPRTSAAPSPAGAIGDLMLVDCAASPFLGHRGRAVMPPRSDEEVLGFQFVCKGVETGPRAARASWPDGRRRGDLGRHQPTDVEIVEPFHKRTLLFPRDRCSRCARGWRSRGAPAARTTTAPRGCSSAT